MKLHQHKKYQESIAHLKKWPTNEIWSQWTMEDDKNVDDYHRIKSVPEELINQYLYDYISKL